MAGPVLRRVRKWSATEVYHHGNEATTNATPAAEPNVATDTRYRRWASRTAVNM